MSRILSVLLSLANPVALVGLITNNAPGADQIVTQVAGVTDWQLCLSIAAVAIVNGIRSYLESRKAK